jgi:hypothetical protein
VCTAAAQAVSAATKVRDDAKDALAAAEAKLTDVINSANPAQADIDAARQARDLKRTALTNAENDLKAKLDAQTRACTTTPTTTPTPNPNPDHRVYSSCADYNRHGIYNIRRGDDRYRPALDRDNDGVACEPGNDDDLNLGRDRSLDGRTCDELKRDFDRSEQAVEDARTNLNRVLRDARRDVSPEGNNLSAEERRDVRTAERVVDDRTGDRDRVRDFRKDVCKDDGGDVTINVHVDPIPVEVNNDPNPLPPASSGGQVSRVPSGGVETGGFEPESNTRALGFAGLALMFPLAGLLYRLIRQDA